MANGKFAEMVDPRLLEAAWHRFEAARALANASRELTEAKERHTRAFNAHLKAATDYETLESEIARGVRIGARRVQAVQS